MYCWTTAQQKIHLDGSMRARRVASRAIPLSEMSHNRNEHVCSTSWTSAHQKTKLLWGEVQRIRRRIRRGFERIRMFLEDSRTKPMFILWVSGGFE